MKKIMICLCMVLAVVFCFTACSEFKVADLAGTWKCVEADPEIPEEDRPIMVLDNKGKGHDAEHEDYKYEVSLGKNKTFTAVLKFSYDNGGMVDCTFTMKGTYSFNKKKTLLEISNITWDYYAEKEGEGEIDVPDPVKNGFKMTYIKFEKQ